MDLKNKKILITGGAGFIGSHTADALIEKGVKVSIIDNLSTGKKANLNPKAKFYKLNIADLKIEEIFKKEKPEIIYHLAFNILVPESVKNPLIDMDSILGSINVLINSCKYSVKKIIFASSEFIYGNSLNLPFKESEFLDPINSYNIAKYSVENYFRFFKKAKGLNYACLRYGTVYGPRQSRGAMTDYILKLSSNKQAKIWGQGNKTRDYVYIGDIVKANLMILDLKDDYPDPVFNVGTGVETSLNELYWEIARLLKKKPKPIYLKDRAGEQMRCCLDCSRIKKAINWEPKYNLKQGLKLRIKNLKI